MEAHSSEHIFASLLQRFFCDYLMQQRNVSPQTVSSYRDTFRLLLRFMEKRFRKRPEVITLGDLNAPQVLGFLDHLEKERGNSVRSRNARLAAIRAFMRYAALHEPTHLPSVNRVLAIPLKKCDRPMVGYLSREEIAALLRAPDTGTWSGQRDRAMLTTLYNTGARVSEIVGLNVEDLALSDTATLKIRGKGRKERTVPLWKSTKRQLREWLRQVPLDAESPLFPNRHRKRLTRSGVRARLHSAWRRAAKNCVSLSQRHISPHLLRHTTAMHLLQSGVDMTVIALWLGHESTATTHIYVEADIGMKKRAIERVKPPMATRLPFRPGKQLLDFLDAL